MSQACNDSSSVLRWLDLIIRIRLNIMIFRVCMLAFEGGLKIAKFRQAEQQEYSKFPLFQLVGATDTVGY